MLLASMLAHTCRVKFEGPGFQIVAEAVHREWELQRIDRPFTVRGICGHLAEQLPGHSPLLLCVDFGHLVLAFALRRLFGTTGSDDGLFWFSQIQDPTTILFFLVRQ